MKKKVLLLATIILLFIMTVVLTACGKNNTEGESSGGLFGKKLSEQVKVGDYIAYNAGEGNSYTSPKLKNGSQDQTFQTTGEEKWRVLSIKDDGTVTLVSEKPLKNNKEKKFTLYGGAGCLNVVEELNNICAIYGNGEHAISARSIQYEDIIKGIGFDTFESSYNITLSGTDDEKIKTIIDTIATKQVDDNEINVNYGSEFSLSKKENQYKPSDENEEGYIEGGEQTLKDDYIPYIRVEDWFTSEKDVLELLFGTERPETFWIPKTAVRKSYTGWVYSEENNETDYYVYNAYTGDDNNFTNTVVKGEILFSSAKHDGYSESSLIRPVVVLDKDTKTTGGTGSLDDPFILK